jgi:hypothetical protein
LRKGSAYGAAADDSQFSALFCLAPNLIKALLA